MSDAIAEFLEDPELQSQVQFMASKLVVGQAEARSIVIPIELHKQYRAFVGSRRMAAFSTAIVQIYLDETNRRAAKKTRIELVGSTRSQLAYHAPASCRVQKEQIAGRNGDRATGERQNHIG